MRDTFIHKMMGGLSGHATNCPVREERGGETGVEAIMQMGF